MMNTINARNVNDAFGHGLRMLAHSGAKETSRNGDVFVMPGPVTTVTNKPCERVLFSPLRDANPFFHLFESLWMLGGRNDLPWLAQFNKQMATYSDDGGQTQPAAYGHRWRNHFGYDQLIAIASELRSNPTSRRCVLTMWDAGTARDNSVVIGDMDLYKAMSGSKDVPCNTSCFFRVRDGLLDMQVNCRSNDAVWGAHGANAVHFSVLLEYLAAAIGVKVGVMYQVSFNYHLYAGVLKKPVLEVAEDALLNNLYTNSMPHTPMFTSDTIISFDDELGLFLEYAAPNEADYIPPPPPINDPFLRGVALPMLAAWRQHKRGNYQGVHAILQCVTPGDWRAACLQWAMRREAAKTGKLQNA